MVQAFSVRHLDGTAREDAERALLQAGIPVALYARSAWALAFAEDAPFYAVFDASDRPVTAFTVLKERSRALPGHALWRVRQLDGELDPALLEVAVRHLMEEARTDPRALRLSIDLFSRNQVARAAAGERLTALGLHRVAAPKEYTRTLLLDFPEDLTELWESAAYAQVRRKVRIVQRAPLAVRVIADPSLGERMGALLEETFARTGASAGRPDFRAMVRVGELAPEASRLVGMFRTAVTGSDALVAFAWATRHGGYTVYDVAASSREPDARKYPLAYALMWDLIQWAHGTGARAFDFGGISPGSQHDGDPLGGISDFKRAFCEQAVDVREEWQYEPRPLRAWAARAVSGAASSVRELRSRARRLQERLATREAGARAGVSPSSAANLQAPELIAARPTPDPTNTATPSQHSAER